MAAQKGLPKKLADDGDGDRSASAFAWRVLERVGEGASSVVHRAERADGTTAALKVERASSESGPSWVGREAALLANLARRWGPTFLDAGRIPEGVDGLPPGARFVATTWTEGDPLDGLLRGSPLDRRILALRVAHGVGRALDELHGMGVRHGDVKPSNVLVGREPLSLEERADTRSVTLIDVGLAASVDGGVLGGTKRYLAPEIVADGAASPAADLFALGVVLSEILADREEASRGDIGLWIEALVAPSPGSRPSAAWLADRAARALGLRPSEEERRASRRARVRRAYLAVRGEDVRKGRPIDPSIEGPARAWLEEALAQADPLVETKSSMTPGSTYDDPIAPMDTLATARWLVALVGPPAASWPLPSEGEGALATRLLALCDVPPEAWTREDVTRAEGTSSIPPFAMQAADTTENTRLPNEARWLTLTRALLVPRPDVRVIEEAETALDAEEAPLSLSIDLASALVRRGDVGRAFAVIGKVKDRSDEAAVFFAEIARRRGDRETAEAYADRARRSVNAIVRDRARALLARMAWDRGALDEAEGVLDDARGAFAAEVRGLVAYARSEFERGLRGVEEASREPHDGLSAARLAATTGMLEHARGHAHESMTAFVSAADFASREGAVVEEASYLTGLAAAAVDAGEVERALSAATRASLLWERLGHPANAARAHLSRASAYALVGARHEADLAAKLARAHARTAGDVRAGAFARWAIVETRAPGDPLARTEALRADEELAKRSASASDDRVRSAARLLVWAQGASVAVEAMDREVVSCSPPARWEWWGARAESLARAFSDADGDGGSRRNEAADVLASLVSLLDVASPVASKGPALASGIRLAEELGDGDVARKLETTRHALAESLRRRTPPALRQGLASRTWTRSSSKDVSSTSLSFAAPQIEQLASIVRALSSRDRLKPLLEQVLDTMILWTGVERGLLLLRAPDGHLLPRAARNLSRRDLDGEQRALSMGIAKRAMDERKTIVATDAFAQIGDLHASVHALRLRSVLAVPLVARGDVLGVVYLDDRVRRDAFGPSELAWVALVASQASLAIADARDQALLRRAVRHAERANARLSADLHERENELQSVRTELARAGETRFAYDEIAGRSEPIRAMLKLVDRVTPSDVPVLLIGESGTGKELVARAIHRNGVRASRPFVSENCGAVPETLLESTLFGHVRGAFTGASSSRQGLFDVANGGTLFLDEIGEMPLAMQTKLLRVLQSGEVRPVGSERVHEVDVRILGATHRDLAEMVANKTFREDLYYRLNVVSIHVPPLRERASDIPLLVAHLLEKHAPGRRIKVTRAAMDRLVAFPWPGNIRQLENELRRALVLADDRVDLSELSDELVRGSTAATREAGLGLKARVDALEEQLVREALERTKGNQTRAAEALGLSRYGLQKMMQRLKIRSV